MNKKGLAHFKEQTQRRRECLGKLRHEHMGSALQHAMGLRRKNPDANINMYDCTFCDFIHVGNVRNGKPELTEEYET
jgi:hypothetical protein